MKDRQIDLEHGVIKMGEEGRYTISAKPIGNNTWRQAHTLVVEAKMVIDGKERHFSGIIQDRETMKGMDET